MARGIDNNNPGNIRLSTQPWAGEIRPSRDRSFCQFTSMAYGYRAMLKLLQNYKTRHGCDTVRKMITRWAPPSENKTDVYIDFVAKKTGISPDASVDVTDRDVMIRIATAISEMENGRKAELKDIEKGWELL